MPDADLPTSTGPDDAAVVGTLRDAIRIPTVSLPDESRVDTGTFRALHELLAERFPLLHATLELTPIPRQALLFRWRGHSSDDPLVLMAHQDVVPIDADAPWTYPPFEAVIADSPEGEAIWGRGTLDDKGSVIAICAAVERLLAEGFTPARDVWLSFGCDEEVFGTSAPAAVAYLRDAGVRPGLVIDEGGAVASGAFPGVSVPVGVVGVAEKGTTTFELRATGRGGHSSTPARNGPTARLARAITAVDGASMRPRLPAPTVELLRRLAPHAKQPLGTVLRRAGSRATPVLAASLAAAGPEAAALTRTTFAVTMLSGSPAANVIASTATATVNARILVGDSVASVHRLLTRLVGRHIDVSVIQAGEPTSVSPFDDPAFALIERTIRAEFPDAVPAPYVVMAGTDARHFHAICERVYRFAPFPMSKAQRESIHAFDERITIDGFLAGVRWYTRLLRDLPQ